MCFAPKRRALFRHLNFQKWSDTEVFCTFWLGNVLRATTACTFSTSQLPKAVWRWGVLYILTLKCVSRHNGVHLFISHLARWLRTHRFSEPTFRPSGASNHWKNTMFRDFPTLSRICIFFLLTLSLLLFSLLIFSLLSASALLCFSSVHIVGSLTSKLPSIFLISTSARHHQGISSSPRSVRRTTAPRPSRLWRRRWRRSCCCRCARLTSVARWGGPWPGRHCRRRTGYGDGGMGSEYQNRTCLVWTVVWIRVCDYYLFIRCWANGLRLWVVVMS